MKKLNREITENQKTTYKLLLLKKRNRENEIYDNTQKRQRKEEHERKLEMKSAYHNLIGNNISLQDLAEENSQSQDLLFADDAEDGPDLS